MGRESGQEGVGGENVKDKRGEKENAKKEKKSAILFFSEFFTFLPTVPESHFFFRIFAATPSFSATTSVFF